MRKLLFLLLIVCLFSCGKKQSVEKSIQKKYSFDLQGHRGARGLAPENTLVAFHKALDLGVNTLELDVVVSKDKQIVVSHEPWFNTALTITPAYEDMEEEKTPSTNFYEMRYEEIEKYDCGSRQHPNFPYQVNEKATKPLLKDVIRIMEQESNVRGINLHYNIEIKSMPQGDEVFHPKPKPYADLVVEMLTRELSVDKFNIQSFDFRILKILHMHYPQIQLAALVEKGNLRDNLQKLGFIPEIYSPNYNLVDSALVAEGHRRNMQIIPWTVNEIKDMGRLLEMGVDGLITDYPDRALLLRE